MEWGKICRNVVGSLIQFVCVCKLPEDVSVASVVSASVIRDWIQSFGHLFLRIDSDVSGFHRC